MYSITTFIYECIPTSNGKIHHCKMQLLLHQPNMCGRDMIKFSFGGSMLARKGRKLMGSKAGERYMLRKWLYSFGCEKRRNWLRSFRNGVIREQINKVNLERHQNYMDGLLHHRLLVLAPKMSVLNKDGVSPRIVISNLFPDGVAAGGLETLFQESLLCRTRPPTRYRKETEKVGGFCDLLVPAMTVWAYGKWKRGCLFGRMLWVQFGVYWVWGPLGIPRRRHLMSSWI